ncbi:SH3-like domain-containing protein [Bacillus licheniformis]|nr:SH3-like domain-containing protein [Bacillus licheniformis]
MYTYRGLSKFNEQEVEIVEEALTQEGTYCKAVLNNKVLGWIGRKSLNVIEPPGIK